MAKRTSPARQPTGDDTEDMLRAAGRPPHEQIAEVLRFIRTDLASDPTNWSGFLKGLPRRPCASDSGRLRVKWLTVREPQPLSRAILQRLQQDLRGGIRNVLGYGDFPPLRGIWNLPAPAQLAMTAEPEGGFAWIYSHHRDSGAEEAPVPGVVLAVAQLVAEHADRIRLCKLPGCGVIFLANKRQAFCTPEHGQETRDQRKQAERKRKAERKSGGR